MIFIYSFSQSTSRPFNLSTTSLPAIWLETVASVTPEEKTGSRNSVTFPVSTKPSPKNVLVVVDQDCKTFGSNTIVVFSNLSLKYGSDAINARNCSSSVPLYFSKKPGSPTKPREVMPFENGM